MHRTRCSTLSETLSENVRPSPTDEEDGEGDEEQENMGNQVESVHEAAIVQHALRHTVGVDSVVAAAK